jgi:hypothetical protein
MFQGKGLLKPNGHHQVDPSSAGTALNDFGFRPGRQEPLQKGHLSVILSRNTALGRKWLITDVLHKELRSGHVLPQNLFKSNGSWF